MSEIRFSVLMPTYNQCAFIRRAILSLMQQTYDKWELIIINDGCTDETEEFIADYLADERITYIKNKENTGLGHALNQGLDAARYDYIAYLPSDDFYFPEHLEIFTNIFFNNPQCVLTFSGLQFENHDTINCCRENYSLGIRSGYCLQLVQTAHKKHIDAKWTIRDEYVTEDLYQMYWHKLSKKGYFLPTRKVSCFWTSHPHQRHRILSERYRGGLNKYRSYYKIKTPIKIRISKQKFTNEEQLYKSYREKFSSNRKTIKILIVGELAYNPERIYALEQEGHRLYGLWMSNPTFSFTTVGPLPFGHIEDISINSIEKIKPDIIYGLLNSSAVPFVYDVVKKYPNIPFVWHFKEGPSVCLKNGWWEKLIYLYQHASGRIFLNSIAKKWYNMFLPSSNVPTLILDGDLPKADYFDNIFSDKLSTKNGAIHTVVTGRMVGIKAEDIETLARNNIHVHLYTENYYEGNNRESMLNVAPYHFHIHPHVSAKEWTKKLSTYDAGWLHVYNSHNGGNLLKATWDDINIPARVATYAAAGLPLIIPQNEGNIVAVNHIAKQFDIGLFFTSMEDLAQKLKEEVSRRKKTENMKKVRLQFCFDSHVRELIELFKNVSKKN